MMREPKAALSPDQAPDRATFRAHFTSVIILSTGGVVVLTVLLLLLNHLPSVIVDNFTYDLVVLAMSVVIVSAVALFTLRRMRSDFHEQQRQLERQQSMRLQEMMDSIALAAVTLDLEGRVVFCNQFFAQLTGWPRAEILGASWFDNFVQKEDGEELRRLVDGLLQSKTASCCHESDLLTRYGQRLRISWNILPARSWQGDVVNINCLGEDITEHLQAERDLETRMKELAALQQAGRFITASLDLKETLGGIVSAARLLLGSESSTIMLHHPETRELEYMAIDGPFQGTANIRQPVVGQRVPDIAGMAGWVIQQGQPVMASNVLDGVPEEDGIDPPSRSLIAVPMMFQHKPVGVLEVSSSASNAFNRHNMITLSLLADFATMSVINHGLIESEREQRRLVERSQAALIRSEKLNAMGRLVAFLAHEINNPLQSLRSGLSLMLDCSLSPEKQREYLEIANREVDRLSSIIERVLGFYRRSSDLQSQVQINLLLDETLKLVEKRLEDTRIQVVREYAPDLPKVVGFYDQLHQVFLNLILNAVNAMPKGGTLTVNTGWDASTGAARITIRDTGVGIAPEDLPHIFEPFFTTRDEGSGLGLPISYSIVEKHQGRIEVESKPGEGAAFIIFLPYYQATVG